MINGARSPNKCQCREAMYLILFAIYGRAVPVSAVGFHDAHRLSPSWICRSIASASMEIFKKKKWEILNFWLFKFNLKFPGG